MKIQFVAHKDIDPKRWDRCIEASPEFTIFATYHFLSITNPFSALILGEYEAVMPLPVRKKYGISYVYQPFFICRLGIFAKEIVNETLLSQFLEAIPKKIKRVELCWVNEETHTQLQPQHSNILSLLNSYQEIHKQYSENTKRNIKAAYKHGLQYCKEDKITETIQLFKENMGRQAHIPFQEEDYHTLEKLARYAQCKGWLESVSVINAEQKVVAGGLFLRDRNKYWFWFSGRNEQLSQGRPMFLLIDEWIKEHAQNDAYLDFNGSKNENIDRFYKSFGGIQYPYHFLHLSNSKIINYIKKCIG